VHSEHFDEKAATWDADPAKVERARDVARRIAADLPLGPSTRVLEYGAGTGLVSQALREHVGPLTLADASSGMREVMQAKVDAGELPDDARIWSLDLAADPPPDERFDLIVTVMVLHHIPDLDIVLERLLALLEPGGHLCIVDLDAEDGAFHGEGFGGHHGFHRPDLVEQLTQAGFGQVVVADCGHMEKDGGTYSLFLARGTRP
jgi:ubiquinone/menaquinone biosynthesis C-methylase UbiE